MKRLTIAATAIALIMLPSAAYAMKRPNAQECRVWFDTVDRNNDGSVGVGEGAAKYLNKITLSGTASGGDADHIMSKRFFLAECGVGSFGAMPG